MLIDGADALPAIAAELRKARSHVHLTGWHFSPDFELERDGVTDIAFLLGQASDAAEARTLIERYRASDLAAVHRYIGQWNPYMDIDLTPVVDDEESAAISRQIIADNNA